MNLSFNTIIVHTSVRFVASVGLMTIKTTAQCGLSSCGWKHTCIARIRVRLGSIVILNTTVYCYYRSCTNIIILYLILHMFNVFSRIFHVFSWTFKLSRHVYSCFDYNTMYYSDSVRCRLIRALLPRKQNYRFKTRRSRSGKPRAAR